MAFSTPLDPLFCQEQPFTLEEGPYKPNEIDSTELLSFLITSQQKTHNFPSNFITLNDPYLHFARKESVHWIRATSSQLGFNALTVLLAVNYLDRCFLSTNGLSLQKDKPWMKQLSAVSCLSLAAKIEETQVPFFLDLQLSADKVSSFVFESKTVRRMELLVLSTLGWRMNPVTSVDLIQCLLPKFNKDDDNAVEILRSCECILLSVLSDWRWVQFPPSVWAAATMLHAMGQPLGEMQNIIDPLEVSKERVEQCYKIILESIGGGGTKRKKCYCEPQSPSEVINTCFSYESSSSLDSWPMWPSNSSSPEPPPPKRPNRSII